MFTCRPSFTVVSPSLVWTAAGTSWLPRLTWAAVNGWDPSDPSQPFDTQLPAPRPDLDRGGLPREGV